MRARPAEPQSWRGPRRLARRSGEASPVAPPRIPRARGEDGTEGDEGEGGGQGGGHGERGIGVGSERLAFAGGGGVSVSGNIVHRSACFSLYDTACDPVFEDERAANLTYRLPSEPSPRLPPPLSTSCRTSWSLSAVVERCSSGQQPRIALSSSTPGPEMASQKSPKIFFKSAQSNIFRGAGDAFMLVLYSEIKRIFNSQQAQHPPVRNPGDGPAPARRRAPARGVSPTGQPLPLFREAALRERGIIRPANTSSKRTRNVHRGNARERMGRMGRRCGVSETVRASGEDYGESS